MGPTQSSSSGSGDCFFIGEDAATINPSAWPS